MMKLRMYGWIVIKRLMEKIERLIVSLLTKINYETYNWRKRIHYSGIPCFLDNTNIYYCRDENATRLSSEM